MIFISCQIIKLISSKVTQEVGPFKVKEKVAHTIIEVMLAILKLPNSFVWKYDPKGVISSKRRAVRLVAYDHQSHDELEKIANLDNWKMSKKYYI